MARARSAAAAVLLFGAVLVCATGAVRWAVRGTMPPLLALPIFTLGISRTEWRSRHHVHALQGAPQAFLWSMAIVIWATSGEVALAVTAAVLAAAALFLAVGDARAYLSSDAAPRPPTDPVRAARLRRAAVPLWAMVPLSLATAAVLGWQEWVLAWPGVTLAVLFGVLAWLKRRDALRGTWALASAGLLGLVYFATGAFLFIDPPRGPRAALVIVVAAALLLVLPPLASILAGRPPACPPGREPPPVPTPAPNR
ncbi:MAG TPA: hypothetical protein VFY93_05020 [Planctomycetota bacterium]|nr:hypothetical protein [Planctomycetota bacterium]